MLPRGFSELNSRERGALAELSRCPVGALPRVRRVVGPSFEILAYPSVFLAGICDQILYGSVPILLPVLAEGVREPENVREPTKITPLRTNPIPPWFTNSVG
jgi:hypothetical protein